MNEDHKRHCQLVYSHTYTYCPKCDKDKDKPYWMFSFCSQNCKDIFQTLIDEQYGHITTAEAKEKLLSLDLSDKSEFQPETLAVVERILSYKEPVITTVTEPEPEPEIKEVKNTSLFSEK